MPRRATASGSKDISFDEWLKSNTGGKNHLCFYLEPETMIAELRTTLHEMVIYQEDEDGAKTFAKDGVLLLRPNVTEKADGEKYEKDSPDWLWYHMGYGQLPALPPGHRSRLDDKPAATDAERWLIISCVGMIHFWIKSKFIANAKRECVDRATAKVLNPEKLLNWAVQPGARPAVMMLAALTSRDIVPLHNELLRKAVSGHRHRTVSSNDWVKYWCNFYGIWHTGVLKSKSHYPGEGLVPCPRYYRGLIGLFHIQEHDKELMKDSKERDKKLIKESE